MGRFGGCILSNASRRVGPEYHAMFNERSIRLSDDQADIGINGTLSSLYPKLFKYLEEAMDP